MWLYHRVMSPNHADGMANSVDPDQTSLFAQAYLSENLGSLRFVNLFTVLCCYFTAVLIYNSLLVISAFCKK